MKAPQRPIVREDLVVRVLEEEVVVYDPVSDVTSLLNQTAALVFELCDGSNDIDGIASALADVFSLPDSQLVVDVRAIVTEFAGQGLFCVDGS